MRIEVSFFIHSFIDLSVSCVVLFCISFTRCSIGRFLRPFHPFSFSLFLFDFRADVCFEPISLLSLNFFFIRAPHSYVIFFFLIIPYSVYIERIHASQNCRLKVVVLLYPFPFFSYFSYLNMLIHILFVGRGRSSEDHFAGRKFRQSSSLKAKKMNMKEENGIRIWKNRKKKGYNFQFLIFNLNIVPKMFNCH